MNLAWLLLEPASSLHTAYSQQVIVCFAQLAIVKRLLGASMSHQSDVFNGFESVQDAGSMRLKTQTSRIFMLLTKPLAMPSEQKRACTFFSTH
jgi:hypothetical protein